MNKQQAKHSVGSGWHELLDRVYSHLPPEATIVDVKEKFGALRISVYGADVRYRNFLDGIESESTTICETCGQPGKLRDDLSWHKTLCDEHYQERNVGG